MNEKPILFSGEMVRAILEGRKSQTRRVIKMADGSLCEYEDIPAHDKGQRADYVMDFSKTYPRWKKRECPYGKIGDRLWVRETWQAQTQSGKWWHQVKREDRPLLNWAWTNPVQPSFEAVPPRWLPGIHMPRMACRLELEVVNVRVERVQEISEADAKAEGVSKWASTNPDLRGYRFSFQQVWDAINKEREYGWEVNPWVWVVEFKAVA